MRRWLRLSAALERVSAAAGRLASWLTLIMVAIGALNALARYLGRSLGVELSSNAYIELQWYLFSAVFLLAGADALREDGHVRVDVFYSRFAPRTRAAIDVLGTLLLLIPFCVAALVLSWPAVENSWALREQSPDPGGLPRYPIKTLIPIAFALLILQGVAVVIRRVPVLFGKGRGLEEGA